MGVIGFWIGRRTRELPIIDDELLWALCENQLPTAAANLEVALYREDYDGDALGWYDI
jgi:hypothetical protein